MNAAVDGSGFVGYGVFLFEMSNKVMKCCYISVFDTKIIDDEGKLHRLGFILKQTWGMFGWEVSVGCQVFYKIIVGESSCLR